MRVDKDDNRVKVEGRQVEEYRRQILRGNIIIGMTNGRGNKTHARITRGIEINYK